MYALCRLCASSRRLRATPGDPRILILDEATSSVDGMIELSLSTENNPLDNKTPI